ncbi:amidohydrolase family protein [Herbaspirillum rhizosphaerae]|uniref:2-amino-3-carboxymuconate-6-semialdehyde decarboxylase n=1 Tax=Herbaspirillum rhizosphaerae TaxID=346179 RepID=A0ABW8ZBM9_9BURK
MADTQCSCGIDVHAHVVPHSFPSYLGSIVPPNWPSMAPAHECHRHVMISGKVYRTVSDRCWDVSKRIADMDETAMKIQVISPMPELLSYWMDARPAQQLLRYINEQLAEMVGYAGGRMAALGAVPLQDVDLAIKELRHLKETLGFSGVELGSNINGKPIGDPVFLPFFEAASDMGASIFVHAVKPSGMERLVGPPQLQQALAYPSDVGLAAASVITSGLLERHPKLRIAFSHGGGTLASLLPRLEQAQQVFPALADSINTPVRSVAQKMYYDALVFDMPTLRHLVQMFGDDRIMIGTDYPFVFRDKKPVERLFDAIGDHAVRERILHLNAKAFLAI